MPKSLLDAERLSLKDAARRVGVSIPTIWRWCLNGVAGRKLPSVQIGGRRFVLVADLEAFLLAGRDAESQQKQHVESRKARSSRADRELEAAGI